MIYEYSFMFNRYKMINPEKKEGHNKTMRTKN